MEEIKSFKVTKRDDEDVDEVIVGEENIDEDVSSTEDTGIEDDVDKEDDNSESADDDGGNVDDSVDLGDFEDDENSKEGSGVSEDHEEHSPSIEDIVSEKTEGRFKNLDDLLDAATKKPEESLLKDDYIKKVVGFYNENGTLEPVLKGLSTDYDKLSDEEIIKMSLREKHPNLSDKAFNRVFEREITEKYHLNEEDNLEEDIEIGKELLHQAANEKRDAWKKQQEEFKIPDNKKGDTDKSETEDLLAENFKKMVDSDPATKELMDNKRIVIKSGESKFNFGVENPEEIKEMAYNESKFWKLFSNGDGGVDFNKFMTVASIARNLDTYNKSLINYGKSIGKKGMMSKIKNSKKPDDKNGATPTIDGNGKLGLLKAFAEKGRHT